MIARIRRTIPLALGLLALTSVGSTARAQGNVFNPYGNSGYADYREFGNPQYSVNPSLPGQAVLNGEPIITRPRANSFQQYSDELNGVDPEARASRGRALPGESYFQASQRLNSTRGGRAYRPNDTPENREFEKRMKQKDALFSKAMEEKDPVKRAQLLRQAQQDALARPLTQTRPRASAGTSTAPMSRTNPAPSATGRAPSPFSSSAPAASGERRTPAPSPFPSTRQPAAAGSTDRRAPNPYRALSPATTAPLPGSATPPDPARRPAPTPDPSSVPVPPPL